MELRHLRYFKAVAEEVHFGRAAKRINLAQPALTRQIRQLEDEIGVLLFKRLPRGVRLTAAGSSLLSDTQRILSEIAVAVERSRSVARGDSGLIRIGFCDGASWDGVMPASFHYFREHCPNVEIRISQMASLEQLDALESSRIDAGFLYNVPHTASEFSKIIVGNCNVLLAVPRLHRLATQEEIRFLDLQQESFVWPERARNPAYHDMLVAACSRAGLTPHTIQEVSDESIGLNLVGTGGIIGLVTSATTGRCPQSVTLRQIADLSIDLHLEFAWRKDDQSPALLAFVRTVSELAEAKFGSQR